MKTKLTPFSKLLIVIVVVIFILFIRKLILI